MRSRTHRWLPACLAAGLVSGLAAGQSTVPGSISSLQKISVLEGGFQGPLKVNDQLGRSIALLGDLDGDGVQDIATAGHSDDDGGKDQGSVYILFLNRDGTVKSQTKISETRGGFQGQLDPGDQFGRAIGNLGDVDGDGVVDIGVGANFDDDGGTSAGAMWVLFLNPDGTVKGESKISATAGGWNPGLAPGDEFGRAITSLGDFDGDGTPDCAVSAPYDDDGNWNSGSIFLIYLNPDGTVKAHSKISQTQGGLVGRIGERDYFGWGLDTADFDQDGVLDIVTGEVLDDSAGDVNAGAMWFLFMNPDGTVKAEQKVNQDVGGFTGDLGSPDQFGVSICVVGDLDGDGVPEVAVGAVKDSSVGTQLGAVWILFPRSDGTIKSHYKISRQQGRFPAFLNAFDWLGSSVAPLGDLDGDGIPDLVSGARNDDDGAGNAGALYVMFLNGESMPQDPAPVASFQVAPLSGPAPLEVTFTDSSAGNVTSWAWDFGDGTTSSLSAPTHVYALPGTYDVSLTVAGPAGSDMRLLASAVRVIEDMPGSVGFYGCGVNPAGSLQLVAGLPAPGATMTLAIDNPLGTQNPGSVPRLALTRDPDPAFPCGSLRPNTGMAGGGAAGELLISIPSLMAVKNGAPWEGAGIPAQVDINLPNDLTLLGETLYLQGLLVDPAPTGGPRLTLTEGLALTIGN